MRLMAIDYGGKRVGIASTDESGSFALPRFVFPNDRHLLEEILEFDKHNFEVPLNKIKEVKIKEFFDRSITFCTKNGKEYKYSTDEKEEIIKIKNIINRYISTK